MPSLELPDETYCTLVSSGRLYKVNGDDDYYPFFDDKVVYPRHVPQLINLVHLHFQRIRDDVDL